MGKRNSMTSGNLRICWDRYGWSAYLLKEKNKAPVLIGHYARIEDFVNSCLNAHLRLQTFKALSDIRKEINDHKWALYAFLKDSEKLLERLEMMRKTES